MSIKKPEPRALVRRISIRRHHLECKHCMSTMDLVTVSHHRTSTVPLSSSIFWYLRPLVINQTRTLPKTPDVLGTRTSPSGTPSTIFFPNLHLVCVLRGHICEKLNFFGIFGKSNYSKVSPENLIKEFQKLVNL